MAFGQGALSRARIAPHDGRQDMPNCDLHGFNVLFAPTVGLEFRNKGQKTVKTVLRAITLLKALMNRLIELIDLSHHHHLCHIRIGSG